jgi:hypothetical protein
MAIIKRPSSLKNTNHISRERYYQYSKRRRHNKAKHFTHGTRQIQNCSGGRKLRAIIRNFEIKTFSKV